MNRFIKYTVVLALSGAAFAQAPIAAQPKTFAELNSEFQLTATKTQLLYNRLRDLRDFQDYLQAVQDMDKISRELQTLQAQEAAKNQPKPSTDTKKP